jgi:hypothetical protein
MRRGILNSLDLKHGCSPCMGEGMEVLRRLFAGCVRQVFPFNSNAGRPPCGCLSCASLASGDSAVSLAPYVRCDVRGAELQVGQTLFERGRVCQCEWKGNR